MKTHLQATVLSAFAAAELTADGATELLSTEQLIARIKSKDVSIRGGAWQTAASFGAKAVQPLAATSTDPDLEVARAAKRALWKIVRHAGRPGAEAERAAVSTELLAVLPSTPTSVRREVLWMLSEIGGDEAVAPVARLLADLEVREDARAALERIPGPRSLSALEAGLANVSEEFKPAVANSLRVRGVRVSGYPSQKLVPTRAVPGAATGARS